MPEAPSRESLPVDAGANVGEPEQVRAIPGLGAGSLFCCASCNAWSRNCGVTYCAKESLTARAERKAARADAIRYQVFLQRLPATKPQAVPA